MKISNILTDYRAHRAWHYTLKEREKFYVGRGEKPWHIYNSPVASYIDTFKHNPLIDEVVIRDNTRGMDLMGSGSILREWKIPGVALTLNDWRSADQKKDDVNSDITVLEGDIISARTWRTIRNLGNFDLIFLRPMGGLENIPLPLEKWILQQMCDSLNPDGILFAQVPENARTTSGAWLRNISTLIGIESFYTLDTLSIKKKI